MSENQIQIRLKEAKSIERQLPIQNNRDIKGFVDYLRVSASDRSSFVPCCCSRSQLDVDAGFHRAFKHFSREEKVQYYYKIITILKSCFDGEEELNISEEPRKSTSLYFFHEDEGNWETRRVEISFPEKLFRFTNGGEEVNLRYYILRNSKKKDKRSLALESIESLQMPPTIRLSNYKQSFEELKDMLEKMIFAATRQKIQKMLEKSGFLPKKTNNTEKTQLRLMKVQSKQYQTSTPLKKELDRQIDFEQPPKLSSYPRTSDANSKQEVDGLEYQKMKVKLINTLTNFASLEAVDKNTYIDLKDNRVRRVFEIKEDDYRIPLEWFSDNLMSCSSFRRWKKTLNQVKSLQPPKRQPNQKLFFEQHSFKEGISLSYIYKREKYEVSPELIFFFDVAKTDPNGQYRSQSHIEYVIWKFQRNKNYLVVSVEGKIQHEGVKVGNLSISLTQQFLGEIDRICSNSNATLLGDSNFNINTVLFEEHFLSQMGDLEEFSLDDNSFYSISYEDDKEESTSKEKKTSAVMRLNHNNNELVQPVLQSRSSLTGPHSDNLLKWKHPMVPFPKPTNPKFKTAKNPGQSPFWQNEFKFNDKGDMVSINTKKLEAQKGVLSQLIKSIGRNLFSGKSILNISLPVTVFSYESNLSLLCKSFCYAPIHLQRAAKASDPIQRFKYIVAFGLGCTNAYIQMDKPFNPILGETFHCLINGCPVYGQQISHHPPISSLFMKGRGYTTYGSYEAKVNMSLNSAKGSNDGITYISFDESNMKKKIVKFTTPPGEVSGIMWGDRIIRGVEKTQYLDVENMLFLQLHFGKHKGTTEFCKYHNGIQGKLVQLGPDTDITAFPNIKPKKIVRQIGVFSGKWTEVLYYEDDLIFNSWREYPYQCEKYPCPLQSDAFYRKDLLLRIEQKMEEAQTAKEQLQNIQRNDRKLRKKYTGRQE